MLNMGVDPSRIIYAHPCKTNSYIRYAAQHGVKQMTFDNAEELYKVKDHFPNAELYLRILTDDSSSLCRLSLKFGASLDATRYLLDLAKELDLNVVGVSFHIGSGATDPTLFMKAIKDARQVFDQAADVGFNLGTLDIGGGFSDDTFEAMASVISQALNDYFSPHVRIIGEPGRYYVSKAFRLACNVIARRTMRDPVSQLSSYMLYLNDGVYGNFSSIMFDHQHPVPKILRCGQRFLHDQHSTELDSKRMTEYSIWGPTCDGIDCISTSCELPDLVDVGDWLYFEEMGGTSPHHRSAAQLADFFRSLHNVFCHSFQWFHERTRHHLCVERARSLGATEEASLERSCILEHARPSCVCKSFGIHSLLVAELIVSYL